MMISSLGCCDFSPEDGFFCRGVDRGYFADAGLAAEGVTGVGRGSGGVDWILIVCSSASLARVTSAGSLQTVSCSKN